MKINLSEIKEDMRLEIETAVRTAMDSCKEKYGISPSRIDVNLQVIMGVYGSRKRLGTALRVEIEL